MEENYDNEDGLYDDEYYHDEDDHNNMNHYHHYNKHNDHHYNNTMGLLGGLSFLGGTYHKYSKMSTLRDINKMMKHQYAFKDSVIGLLGKEIQDLHFLNQKLSSSGRKITSAQNNIIN